MLFNYPSNHCYRSSPHTLKISNFCLFNHHTYLTEMKGELLYTYPDNHHFGCSPSFPMLRISFWYHFPSVQGTFLTTFSRANLLATNFLLVFLPLRMALFYLYLSRVFSLDIEFTGWQIFFFENLKNVAVSFRSPWFLMKSVIISAMVFLGSVSL